MRMLSDKVVDVAVEAGSVSHFLEKTWDLGLVDAKSLVDCLCGHAVHDARGRFDRHRVWSAIIAGINVRDANLKSQLGPLAVEVATEVAAAYDVTHRVLCSLLYQNSRVAQAGRQLDGDPANTLTTELKRQRDDALKRCLARHVDAPSDDCGPAFARPS